MANLNGWKQSRHKIQNSHRHYRTLKSPDKDGLPSILGNIFEGKQRLKTKCRLATRFLNNTCSTLPDSSGISSTSSLDSINTSSKSWKQRKRKSLLSPVYSEKSEKMYGFDFDECGNISTQHSQSAHSSRTSRLRLHFGKSKICGYNPHQTDNTLSEELSMPIEDESSHLVQETKRISGSVPEKIAVDSLPLSTVLKDSIVIKLNTDISCSVWSINPSGLPFKFLYSNDSGATNVRQITTDAVVFEALFNNPKCLSNRKIVVEVNTEDPEMKVKQIQEALECVLKEMNIFTCDTTDGNTIPQVTCSQTKKRKRKQNQYRSTLKKSKQNNPIHKKSFILEHSYTLPPSLKTKTTKSVIYAPFPNVHFKIRVLRPLDTKFETTYSESMIMFPKVTTTGYLFLATLLESKQTNEEKRALPTEGSKFSCYLATNSSDPIIKFEEIKQYLRNLCDAYSIGIEDDNISLPNIIYCPSKDQVTQRLSENFVERTADIEQLDQNECVGDNSTTSKLETSINNDSSLEVLMQQHSVPDPPICNNNTFTNEIDCNGITNSIPELDIASTDQDYKSRNGVQTMPKTRSSMRKKTIALKENFSYPRKHGNVNKKIIYSITSEDREYLDNKFNLKHFINDLTGVPVVVLERLSDEQMKHSCIT